MNTQQAFKLAFNSPDTSNACISLAKLFAKKNIGYDFETIKKEIKFDQASIWFTLDRLISEIEIVETYPEFPEGDYAEDEEVKIPYKFRIKKEYESELKQYA